MLKNEYIINGEEKEFLLIHISKEIGIQVKL